MEEKPIFAQLQPMQFPANNFLSQEEYFNSYTELIEYQHPGYYTFPMLAPIYNQNGQFNESFGDPTPVPAVAPKVLANEMNSSGRSRRSHKRPEDARQPRAHRQERQSPNKRGRSTKGAQCIADNGNVLHKRDGASESPIEGGELAPTSSIPNIEENILQKAFSQVPQPSESGEPSLASEIVHSCDKIKPPSKNSTASLRSKRHRFRMLGQKQRNPLPILRWTSRLSDVIPPRTVHTRRSDPNFVLNNPGEIEGYRRGRREMLSEKKRSPRKDRRSSNYRLSQMEEFEEGSITESPARSRWAITPSDRVLRSRSMVDQEGETTDNFSIRLRPRKKKQIENEEMESDLEDGMSIKVSASEKFVLNSQTAMENEKIPEETRSQEALISEVRSNRPLIDKLQAICDDLISQELVNKPIPVVKKAPLAFGIETLLGNLDSKDEIKDEVILTRQESKESGPDVIELAADKLEGEEIITLEVESVLPSHEHSSCTENISFATDTELLDVQARALLSISENAIDKGSISPHFKEQLSRALIVISEEYSNKTN